MTKWIVLSSYFKDAKYDIRVFSTDKKLKNYLLGEIKKYLEDDKEYYSEDGKKEILSKLHKASIKYYIKIATLSGNRRVYDKWSWGIREVYKSKKIQDLEESEYIKMRYIKNLH